ncbi:sigma-70 family RNA polymerase sigma factor [Paenibacillus aurantiacus]|uniref:Sigma-70 family RNA polymerase sigma factor n=1 Tax=Paenibacillus aurantiacus TaxID=1936118 RepID=A0ABV5KZQ4_9BACL
MGKRREHTPLTEEQKELIETHIDLVRPIAIGFTPRGAIWGYGLEELIAEGRLALVIAVQNYKPDNPVPFEAYARSSIRGSIKNFFRDRARIIRLPRLELLRIKDTGGQEDSILSLEYSPIGDPEVTIETIVGVDMDYSIHDVSEFLDRLSPEEQQVINYRMAGLSQREIAQRMELSQMTISRMIQRIGKKYLQQ